MLLRVASSQVRTVEVVARWSLPGGQELTTVRQLFVSGGMCLLPWTRNARSVEVKIALPEGTGVVVVDRARYGGEALELDVSA